MLKQELKYRLTRIGRNVIIKVEVLQNRKAPFGNIQEYALPTWAITSFRLGNLSVSPEAAQCFSHPPISRSWGHVA